VRGSTTAAAARAAGLARAVAAVTGRPLADVRAALGAAPAGMPLQVLFAAHWPPFFTLAEARATAGCAARLAALTGLEPAEVRRRLADPAAYHVFELFAAELSGAPAAARPAPAAAPPRPARAAPAPAGRARRPAAAPPPRPAPALADVETLFLGLAGLAWPCSVAALAGGYRRVARLLHPDRHPEDRDGAHQRFIGAMDGYERLRRRAGGGGGAGRRRPGGPTSRSAC
jgi:hypothetical protein